MNDWSIKFRLQLLLGFLAAALLVVGGLGLFAMHSAEEDFESIYTHQVLPLRGVDRIRSLVIDNSSHVFRSIQHNPAYEYAKLHDHPVDQHLDVVEANIKVMNETFVSLKTDLIAGSEEAALLPEIEGKYLQYIENILRPATAALKNGDYSSQVVSKFLKANRAFEKEFNEAMKHLVETQQHSVQARFEAAKARNQSVRNLSLLAIVLGLLVGVGLGIKIIVSIVRPLDAMRDVMVLAANKDFTRQVPVSQGDEVGQTAAAFNQLMQNLRTMFAGLKNDMVKIDDATANLASAAEQASVASGDSSGAASAMAASVEQMSVSISSVSDNTRDALAVARTAGEDSETGGVVIADAVHEMETIAEQVRKVGSTITVLGDHSQKISSVVQVIKDVADQTNLLALNAAIEAARAGEAGRGFAVVADEVRKLAERTTHATGEIAEMINAIQSSSQTAVATMETTMDRLQKGSELAASAGVAIGSIRTSNHHVLQVVRDINEAMIEQGAASQDIAQRVERVAQASEQSSASVLISANAAQEIHRLSMEMRTEVDRFKV